MNSKKCLKCGHIAQFSEQLLISCPHCGAIYSKVEQALQNPQPLPRPATAPQRPVFTTQVVEPEPHHAYAEEMRADSLYPTFRALTKAAYFFMVGIAVLTLVLGVYSFFKLGGEYLIGSVVGAIFIYLLARVCRELSLMLADLSDATVRMASDQSARS